MNPLRYVTMVLWSFFGIRRRAGASDELSRVHPLAVVATAVLLAGGFVGLLVWMAHAAVASLS